MEVVIDKINIFTLLYIAAVVVLGAAAVVVWYAWMCYVNRN